MKRVVYILLIFLMMQIPSLALAQEYSWLKPPPLPQELSDYYQQQKKGLRFEISVERGGPKKIFPWEEEMILHDTGFKDEKTSKMAKEYLLQNAIKPLMERKSVELQDGSVVEFEQLNRLAQAELLYYYVRDHILFPHPKKSFFSSIPILGRISLRGSFAPHPCEAVAKQEGDCMGKAMALASLLKICGYDVALGYFPAFVIDIGVGPTPTLFYHNYVFLKDEGWGIGKWKLEKDMWGNEMEGDWIILDSICSPRHVPHMEMVGGEHKVLKFGDEPVWVQAENLHNEPSCWGTDKFCWFKI
jgi:hypothetical protein